MPSSFSVAITILSPVAALAQSEEFLLFVHGGTGPSGANLLARFARDKSRLAQEIRSYVQEEENQFPDAIVAEVNYFKPGTSGNITYRPSLRRFEIACSVGFSKSSGNQINLDDLYLTLDHNDNLILLSESLGKQVIPRLSSAHNFSNINLPPIYRFLGYLQHERMVSVPRFTWGPLNTLSFLPRVRFGKLILAARQWRLTDQDLTTLIQAKERDSAYIALCDLFKAKHIPRYVTLLVGEGGEALPVDINNVLSIDSIVPIIRKYRMAIFQESIGDHDNLGVSSTNGTYQHELIVPFTTCRQVPQSQPNLSWQHASIKHGYDHFSPGSNWLYFKLFGSHYTLDRFLASYLFPFITSSDISPHLISWFFVRYNTPDNHLRIRFKGNPEWLISTLLPTFTSLTGPLVEQGWLSKFELSTYIPEIVRYGGLDALSICEDVFTIDSEVIVNCLAQINAGSLEIERWKLTILSLHRLLIDLLPDVKARHSMALQTAIYLKKELHFMPDNEHGLKKQYRRLREELRDLISVPKGHEILETIDAIFKERSAKLAPIVYKLAALQDGSSLTSSYSDIVASILHMHINRISKEQPRMHELISYDIIARVYASEIARQEMDASLDNEIYR